MNDRHKRLAAQLEKLRLTLLALETYMAQVRDVAAATRALIDEGEAELPARKPRPKRVRTT